MRKIVVGLLLACALLAAPFVASAGLPFEKFSDMTITTTNAGACRSGLVLIAQTVYKDTTYLLFIGTETNRWLLARMIGEFPDRLYMGFYDTAAPDKIVIAQEAAFDPAVHTDPCSSWLDHVSTSTPPANPKN